MVWSRAKGAGLGSRVAGTGLWSRGVGAGLVYLSLLLLPAEARNQTGPGAADERKSEERPVNLKSQYLPDSLPAGDPVHFALPVFLKEPEDNYIVKSKSAELECRVAHALSVHFQCNDEVQQQARTEDHVDPQTGIRYTRATVEISRNQVEEFFGEYHCACVAVSGLGHSKSRPASVVVAYIKKEFETPPYSDQSALGKPVEVRCHGPKGRPEPRIHWLKNGAPVGDDDPNFIVTSEGHLILVSARLQDSGNYTCVAENLAGRRLSNPAEISIFASGGWSDWSSWSSCSLSCGRGFKQRGRICSTPSNPKTCQGQNVQKKNCETPCPVVDGNWSTWSSWSPCSKDCKQSRRRECDDPAPKKGGHFCFGVDTETVSCKEEACSGVWVEPSVSEEGGAGGAGGAGGLGSSEIALYIGLSMAVLVFILVVLVAVSLVRRRRTPNGYALTQSVFEADRRKKVLGYNGGDLTGMKPADLTSVCYEYSYPDSNSNHSKGGYRPASEHHYEQPMVIMASRSPVDSIVKPLISDTSSSSTGGNISPRSAGTFDRSPTQPTPPRSQPAPTAPELGFTKWCAVTSAGARISLPESGISLTVPEGALCPGQTQDMFVSVVHDTKCYPDTRDGSGQTLLSPVVLVGPGTASRLLKKPVIISFPHVASLRHGNWTIAVASSDTEGEAWRRVVILGQETINTSIYTQLDLNICHIVSDTLAGYALVGYVAPPLQAYKSLRIAAFSQEYPQGSDLTVRLYCVQDTDDAVKFVTETERQFGGRLLDKPVSTLLQAGGQNLRLQVDRLGEGWSVQPGASLQEVPFSHLWTNNNPNLHCSFTLRNKVPSTRTLVMQVHISQEGNANKCLLKVNTTISGTSGGSGGRGGESKLRPSSSRCSSNDSYSNLVFRLPAPTKETLGKMLDKPVAGGNDWRLLAERLNVHRYTAFFASRPSPTEAILNLWEARNRESSATQGLLGILRGMGRLDCAHLLEHDLQLV